MSERTWIYSKGEDGQHVLTRESGKMTVTIIYERTALSDREQVTDGDKVVVSLERVEFGNADDLGTVHVYVGRVPVVAEWVGHPSTSEVYLLRRAWTLENGIRQKLEETAVEPDRVAQDLVPADFCSVAIRKVTR